MSANNVKIIQIHIQFINLLYSNNRIINMKGCKTYMEGTTKHKGWRQFVQLVRGTKPSKLLLSIALFLSISTTLVGLLVPLFTKT